MGAAPDDDPASAYFNIFLMPGQLKTGCIRSRSVPFGMAQASLPAV